MFWQDEQVEKGKRNIVRVMPPIPDTGWRAPRDLPNLSHASAIAIDTETWDPELLENGPGWARHRGHIVGVSLSVPEGYSWYLPIRHSVMPEDNLDPGQVLKYLQDMLGNPVQPKVGANLLYDVGWLREEGVHVHGELMDVQFAEALLDERATTNLDDLGARYVGEHKESNTLYQWCSDFYGGGIDGKQRANIHRAPPCLVGPYAQQDARLPMQVLMKQWPRMEAEGLLDLFRMECGLIPLLIEMRLRGACKPRRG
jgi:DNA polymerase-1